jgi:spermidine/putrescine transport system substrate-binding protein
MTLQPRSKTGSFASAGLAALSLAVSAVLAPAMAEDKLQYFTWSGYELPEFNKSFLAAHPDGVEATMFGDDDDAFTKVKAGFRPDVAHPCYDKVARWNKEGLLQPIDTSRIKNWDSIFPVFKNLPDLQAGDGKVWMVPWDWGNTSILYRTDLVKDPEPSWNLLWNKDYAGRLATIDAVHDTPVVAAILAGVNPFDMTQEEMDKVADKLREQRPLLSSYTTDMTSVEQALSSGELVAAMTWNASATTLKKQGLAVEFMKPKEGMLTWSCGFVLLKDAKNVDLAYDFINSRLETESGKYLIEAYGYGSSTTTAFAAVPQAELDRLQLPADPEAVLKSTVFTGPMKQNDDLAKMFERVKAGG